MSYDEDMPSYVPHQEGDAPLPSYEDEPLGRQEYIAAMVHFYRGELQRTLEWRRRMDTTTHWALITTVGIVTFSFSNPHYAQETLITGMYANLMYLTHEARRFRFFDMWRTRLRMIEENFYGPILRRRLVSPISGWGEQVATDLLHPKFKITRKQAMRAAQAQLWLHLRVPVGDLSRTNAAIAQSRGPECNTGLVLHWRHPLVGSGRSGRGDLRLLDRADGFHASGQARRDRVLA